jgi:Transglycosylase SLT domain
MPTTPNAALSALFCLTLAGCGLDSVEISLPTAWANLPPMPWDGQEEGATWTTATLVAVQAQDAVLTQAMPDDIDAYCPGYAKATTNERRAFWTALVALTAKAESGYNAEAVGQGRYFGLMQISPKTASYQGCSVSSKSELKDGENNLFCAVQILSDAVAADGQAIGAKGNRGIGRDWMPWRKASFRAKASSYLSSQPYCKA